MEPPTKIAVVGATGRVGRHVVDVLTERGHDVVPISRSGGVDVVTGSGLKAAVAGVDVIIDVATGPSAEEAPAAEFFTTSARNLHEVGAAAGVSRMVVVSIIGTDRFAGGYAAAKVAHEKAALAGPVPVRIVRAAQFHEFVPQLVEWGRQGDVSFVQRMRIQPVAARTVAEVLVDVATDPEWMADPPDGPFAEVAGPQAESLVDLAATFAAGLHDGPRIEGVSNPAAPDSLAYEAGALLPGPDAVLAGPAFKEWLDTPR
jgi:uncharacterized protein YbjT (DUF2867 family)